MKKALVIGGSATVGPFVVDGLLKRGYEVAVLHRGVHEVELPSEVEHIHCDPHFAESLQGGLQGRSFDVIVASYGRLKVTAEVVKGHTPRLVSVGGAAGYKGWARMTEPNPWRTMEELPVPIREDDPLATAPGVDRFSEQIRLAERTVMEAHEKGHYNATHFRYPYVYGPRHLIPMEWSIMRRIMDGRKRIILPGGGMSFTSRGYAENYAHALLLAIDNPTASRGQVYNVSDERAFSTRDWVRMIAQAMHKDLEFVEIPFSVLLDDFTGAPAQALFPFHQVVDISKIKTQLGYRDAVPPEKGLETSVQWLLEHPLKHGGDEETHMGDPFDYAAEDKMIDIWDAASAHVKQQFKEVPHASGSWSHPYAHPKKQGDVK